MIYRILKFCSWHLQQIFSKTFDYIFNVLIWIDQGVNVLFAPFLNIIFKPGKFGNPDETLSSVFGKNQDQCKLCSYICRMLHIIDKNHCEKSVEYDER